VAQCRYQTFQLSARAVMSYATEKDGTYTFNLSASATEKCRSRTATHEQDSNALFFQTMCVLRDDGYAESTDGKLIPDLSDAIFYMDFAGVFDRSATNKKQRIRQEKTRAMFRPEGVGLDFGSGPHRYVAFERSGSMSRQARLSFIRADLYDAVRQRIMLGMDIDRCQLSKLYAYNGLMLSSGTRIDGVDIDRPHRVVVVDNRTRTEHLVPVITVEDDGTKNTTRKYRRVEKKADVEVTCFDGEGLISPRFAAQIDRVLCGGHVHTSFQIRLPYVKGMLHQVDFHTFLTDCGTRTITDLWGVEHQVKDVDVILTRSMCKGLGWMTECGMTWADYWDTFRRYRHALYITNVSKERPEQFTELNYQFLATVSVRADEFRPADLPGGWAHSPEEDERHWLTKQTELAYYNFRANGQFRRDYFLRALEGRHFWEREKGQNYYLAAVLKKNPLFINEPVYTQALDDMAKRIVKNYAVGRLIVAGDNRYLSGDLLDFLVGLLDLRQARTKRERTFYAAAFTNAQDFPNGTFYAPGAAYPRQEVCTLLRNPHIARNEEIQLSFYDDKNNMRQFYFRQLTDVVMVSSNMLAAERLGGADYDGDMVKTAADPIIDACVRRNYDIERFEKYKSLDNRENLPLLMIPAAEPRIASAHDWEARFEAVRDTFSSRVGQICNAALDRSIIAYNENSDDAERQRCREETELLAILTGLEIDAAKSGVRPDLEEFLGQRTVKRTPFLQYKYLAEHAGDRRAWYEPTHAVKLKAFFNKVDWSKVDSNVERLPYLAHQLKKHTPKLKAVPVRDGELFIFAAQPNWQNKLDKGVLTAVGTLLKDYEACLSRIRACRVPIRSKGRKNDVERILFSRGQEEEWDADELYAQFGELPPERVTEVLEALRREGWQFLDAEARERFLLEWLPEFEELFDLLADFRFGGYRVLPDILLDIDQENAAQDRKRLTRDGDSPAFAAMMGSYQKKTASQSYRDVVSVKCRELLDGIVKPVIAVRYVVALGRRGLLWELLPDTILPNVLEVRYAE
jgi:hypothetical protein